jgi:LuxR family maltose regulon positive regulatory protein
MDDERDFAEESGRQRIIQRPRLTRLLDESPSRILMLVAPAGYGKTTLARQWLAARPHGWYRGTGASADVAALAIGLAEAAQAILPGAGERMQERLRATGTPEEDVVALAELLAGDLDGWPDDAWLAFDDYHFACRSEFSERFVDLLCSLTRVRLLLTTRIRPSWATSRRLLYGEVHELGRTFLAMTQDEALEVLGESGSGGALGLVALAEGWPAVIGLASLTEGRKLPEDTVPATLHDYFAEELYQAASPAIQWRLSQLGLVPSVTTSLAVSLLGRDAHEVLAAGLRLGFLTSPARGLYDTHPLLRTFLESKFREAPESETTPVALKLGRDLVDRELWDDAFDLVERFFSERLLLELIELALPSVLRDARLPTLDRWVEFGLSHGVDSPVLNLAEAEISFRRGERTRAEALALRAAKHLPESSALRVPALLVAGASAHLNNRDEQALAYHTEADELADTEGDRWEALRGQLISAIVLERPNAAELLDCLSSLNDGSTERAITFAAVRFHFQSRLGTVVGESRLLEDLLYLAPRVKNLSKRANLFFQLSQAYLLEGRYRDALNSISRITVLVREQRLSFLLPLLALAKARGELGLRNFSRSLRIVEGIAQTAGRANDTYLAVEALLLKARLHLAEGLFDQALEDLDGIPNYSPPLGEQGEYLLGRALTLACRGEVELARDLVFQGTRTTQSLQVRTLAPCVLAIAALQEGSETADALVLAACDVVRSTGDIDSFVSAYRSYPGLLEPAARNEATKRWLLDVLRNGRDNQIAARLGLKPPKRVRGTLDLLSARETEVFDLLVQGLTNRQIAKALYISESTAKVHVRHIFEKLGVRSRVEAAMMATSVADDAQATSANGSE